MSKTWADGSSAAWKKVRAAVLLRDGYRCQLRLPGTCVGTATHVHHTQDRSVVGDDPMYLIAACGRATRATAHRCKRSTGIRLLDLAPGGEDAPGVMPGQNMGLGLFSSAPIAA